MGTNKPFLFDKSGAVAIVVAIVAEDTAFVEEIDADGTNGPKLFVVEKKKKKKKKWRMKQKEKTKKTEEDQE